MSKYDGFPQAAINAWRQLEIRHPNRSIEMKPPEDRLQTRLIVVVDDKPDEFWLGVPLNAEELVARIETCFGLGLGDSRT